MVIETKTKYLRTIIIYLKNTILIDLNTTNNIGQPLS